MKKLLLTLSVIAFYSCSQEDCTRPAIVHTFGSYPNTFVVDDFPYDCETGQPDIEEAKKRDKTITFVQWK